MVSDEAALAVLWNRCRFIGIINKPADGNKVKSWLRWHVDFFVISVVTFVGFLFKGRTCSSDDNIYCYIPLKLGITIIVLMIEINVVRKFNKEFNIFANRHNQKCIL
ncbi:unnamed protein product [Macrosiphum euphorbiae]|uniref:Uncharacterized protein n=1 Tax=Macrosiphum euphorbiae TaxID=13131 RepID=A0AAV0VWS1_9HEMI|nr:unnamed protein product [Macrosiphum euphorbiae]